MHDRHLIMNDNIPNGRCSRMEIVEFEKRINELGAQYKLTPRIREDDRLGILSILFVKDGYCFSKNFTYFEIKCMDNFDYAVKEIEKEIINFK